MARLEHDVAETRSQNEGGPPFRAEVVRGRSIAPHAFGPLVGGSATMREVYGNISRVAPTNATVLIVGESGTGKELVASTVHDLSRRRHGPYVALNCGALSPTLIESELFGHERGSFSGADRRHRGVFERATGGTLFLDEIAEMPTDLQVKLLRVLEAGAFMRTGGEVMLPMDVRFVAAMNRQPEEAVRQGKLREDLYYRLKVFQLALGPLRERVEDVVPLTEHFLAQIVALEGETKRFTPEALTALHAYGWPGNVRELKNVVYSAYILADSVMTLSCLPPEVQAQTETQAQTMDGREWHGVHIPVRIGMTAAEAERRLIVATLEHHAGSKRKTARTLGISIKTLYNRLHEYGMSVRDARIA